jgi:hypothetical protein
MNLPLDKPLKYGPQFMIFKIKGSVNLGSNDHEIMTKEEGLSNQHFWMEVKAIMEA